MKNSQLAATTLACSLNRINKLDPTALAEKAQLRDKIDAMLGGEKINVTEDRAVLHTATRAPADAIIEVDGRNVVPDVHDVLAKIKDFSERVRNGEFRGSTGKTLKDVVVIGIGGSYLGPAFVHTALKNGTHRMPESRPDLPYVAPKLAAKGRTLHFLANVDPIDVADALEHLVRETLAMMNEGARLNDIVHSVTVDPAVLEKPYLRPMYDEPEFIVRNIWRLYGGWYDGNPANLWKLPPTEVGERYVDLAGGPDALLAKARAAFDRGDYRWVVEVVNHLVFSDPTNEAARELRPVAVHREVALEQHAVQLLGQLQSVQQIAHLVAEATHCSHIDGAWRQSVDA